MEPPPPPPVATPPLSAPAQPQPLQQQQQQQQQVQHQLSYADSLDSSPRSRNTDSWDDSIPPGAGGGGRLRLMCSYGGHIIPRPHDKSLCYVGGETRIVVVDRNTSLADLSSRLSKTLLGGRGFTLKYQLPSEDLDSLISVTTDEDLDNMIDEYDRTSASGGVAKPSRLRLFLFATKPESSQSIGPILDNPTKSEDWFLNALNGAAGMLNRGYSDSASVNCLLGLDDDVIAGVGGGVGSGGGGSGSREMMEGVSQPKNAKQQDVHSVPDSPMLETTSSFGSTSSSPSLANLPPIRVHVEEVVRAVGDQKVGMIEEQFAQMSVAAAAAAQAGFKPEESSGGGGFVVLSSPPPMPPTAIITSAGMVPVNSDYAAVNRVISDDERSDHGVPVGYRKLQPQPVQPQTLAPPPPPPQSQQKSTAVLDLPSPDSVSSDGSFGNPLSRPKPVIYHHQQDPVVQIPTTTTRIPSNTVVDPKMNISDPNARFQLQQQQQQQQQHQQHQQQQHQQQQHQQHQQQQNQESGYVLQPQFEQKQQQPQQFIHPGAQYIHHHPAGTVPISAYYPVYTSQQQHHPHHQHQVDQQYPVYYVPARQPQQAAYNNLSVQQQSNMSEGPTGMIPSSHPQAHPNPAMVPPPGTAYNPVRNAPMGKPEIAAGVYRTATSVAPQSLVQVPSAQHHHQQQQQYVGYSQIHHHPSQSVAPSSAANYGYEYADPGHAHQLYYTQPLAPTMTSQYQTMTGTAAAVVMPEVSGQLPADNMKQQMRTSQPL